MIQPEVNEEGLWEELPTEILVHLFDYLSARDLLRGPSHVCRRWREAALDAEVWSPRSFSDQDVSPSTLRTVLNVAPCLSELSLDPSHSDSEMLELAATSACAVNHLELSDFEQAARIIQQQSTLGRLTSVEVVLGTADLESGEQIMQTVAEARLLKLVFIFQPKTKNYILPMAPTQCATGKIEASLKYLGLWNFSSKHLPPDSFLETLLETHGATLEVAVLWIDVSQRALELLGKCVRLHEIEIPYPKDLRVLEGCAHQLQSVTMGTSRDPLQLVPLMRKATQLTSLSFLDCIVENCVHPSAVELVAALASSGLSALRELRFAMLEDSEVLRALPAALAGLPSLHELHLCNFPPQDALESICPRNALNLRLLKFCTWFEMCKLSSCSLVALRSLVLRNPRLHVMWVALRHACSPSVSSKNCLCCQSGLHIIAIESCCVYRGLFGHTPSETCDLEEHTDSEDEWLWVENPARA